MLKEIHLASTQGFCAGVASAIEVVERALVKYGTPLYVRHQIVHNTTVIRQFEQRGVVFIEQLAEVPENHTVIFSAHGTAPYEYENAKKRGLHIIDATCPLVSRVHREAVRFSEKGIQTILIGHRGHQELIGTSGYVDPTLLHVIETEDEIEGLQIDPNRPLGYLTQTTLSVTDTQRMIQKLRQKYPDIKGPPKADICFATQNRQNSVKDLTDKCDVVVVCGSPTSSNSNRLKECSEEFGVQSYIIDTVSEFDFSWLNGKERLGITSGASVPQEIVDELVASIRQVHTEAALFQEPSIEKDIRFPIPSI